MSSKTTHKKTLGEIAAILVDGYVTLQSSRHSLYYRRKGLQTVESEPIRSFCDLEWLETCPYPFTKQGSRKMHLPILDM